MPTIRQDGRMQARLAYPSEYLVGQVREYLLKTSEQARRLGTCYSKSGPRRPQRLSSKCPSDTNCDSQNCRKTGIRIYHRQREQRCNVERKVCCRRQPAEERQNSQPRTLSEGCPLGALLGCAPCGPCLDAAHSPTDDAAPQPAGRKLGALADSLCNLKE